MTEDFAPHQPVARAPQRMSKQRAALLHNMAEHSVFRSAQDIHASLVADGQSTSLATVYRNLLVLEEGGDVDAVRGANGEMLYRSCSAAFHHHHLICSDCGKAEEVELGGMEDAIQRLAREHGYELLDHTLELVGICNKCQQHGKE